MRIYCQSASLELAFLPILFTEKDFVGPMIEGLSSSSEITTVHSLILFLWLYAFPEFCPKYTIGSKSDYLMPKLTSIDQILQCEKDFPCIFASRGNDTLEKYLEQRLQFLGSNTVTNNRQCLIRMLPW